MSEPLPDFERTPWMIVSTQAPIVKANAPEEECNVGTIPEVATPALPEAPPDGLVVLHTPLPSVTAKVPSLPAASTKTEKTEELEAPPALAPAPPAPDGALVPEAAAAPEAAPEAVKGPNATPNGVGGVSPEAGPDAAPEAALALAV